jgi:hypothetical protein
LILGQVLVPEVQLAVFEQVEPGLVVAESEVTEQEALLVVE